MAHADRYTVFYISRDSEITEFQVMDKFGYPDDEEKNRLERKLVTWAFIKHMEAFIVAKFPVNARIPKEEAQRMCHEYAKFMNDKDLAIKTATALIGL